MSVMINNSHISCGVKQVYDLDCDNAHGATLTIGQYQFPHANLSSLTRESDRVRGYGAMYMFSDTDSNLNGSRLAEYLESINCGPVVESSFHENPNTGNRIKVWIFAPNANFLDWYRKNK